VSHQDQNGARPLCAEEDSLIRALLRCTDSSANLLDQTDCALVQNMDDGGMGSLRFAGEELRSLGSCLVEAEYVDSDGVPVSITLNADTSGRLYELDMWKVDFTPLRKYPAFESVSIKT
jgi:hypothetical protein